MGWGSRSTIVFISGTTAGGQWSIWPPGKKGLASKRLVAPLFIPGNYLAMVMTIRAAPACHDIHRVANQYNRQLVRSRVAAIKMETDLI
jgi:hypothetical protein